MRQDPPTANAPASVRAHACAGRTRPGSSRASGARTPARRASARGWPAASARIAPIALVLALAGCARQATLEKLGAKEDCRQTVIVGGPARAIEAAEAAASEAAASEAAASEAAASESPTPDSTRDATSDQTPDSPPVGPTGVEPWAVQWRLPPEATDVGRLNAWCAAVGPAVSGGWGELGATARVDTLWLVSWNVHVGGGDLARLVGDLRAGELTGGRPVEHFVVLLQESYRAGDHVPAWDPTLPGGSGIDAAPPGSPREDVVAVAKRLGLFLVYVPSMRNGESEDRGNAILSTLPLRDPVAIALPVARQRRVAIAATVSGRAADGRDWRLQVASVHLESSPRGWSSDEGQRLEQAEALVDLLPGAEAAVAAGDFNTKTRGREEALVRVMLRAYPETPRFPSGPTYQKVRGLYREYLDYIFYRLPQATAAGADRVVSTYHSDHFPLVGWIAW